MDNVIIVDGMTKRYGRAAAVDGISFEVGRGEIFGILGRNGAGKTTTVECLQGSGENFRSGRPAGFEGSSEQGSTGQVTQR